MRQLKSGIHPQLDGCCFPVLHPRATLGWRFFMQKAKTDRLHSKEEKEMQKALDDAKEDEFMEQPNDIGYGDEDFADEPLNDKGEENAALDEDTAAKASNTKEISSTMQEHNDEPANETGRTSNPDVFIIFDPLWCIFTYRLWHQTMMFGTLINNKDRHLKFHIGIAYQSDSFTATEWQFVTTRKHLFIGYGNNYLNSHID